MNLEKNALLEKIRVDIESAESYFEAYIKPKLVERYQIYNADPDYYARKFPKLGKRSSVVSTDVADTIEWALPSLMRIFFGGEDVITIKGRQAEDEKKAELMQELINFQIQVQNSGFMVFYRWFKDALIGGLGVIKCWWEKEVEDQTMKGLFSIEEAEAMKQAENIEVVKIEPTENGVYAVVTYKLKKIKKNQPVFTNIPPNEFIYHPDASTVKDATFVAHRKLVTADYLRKKAQEGIYDKTAVEEAISKGQEQENINLDEFGIALKPNQSQFTPPQVDEARKILKLYECYTKYDINNDGLLEPVIITVVNDTILRVEENLYGRPPFFVLAPILEPYEIWGKSFSDILADIQAIKTALIRQILVNIALNNDPKLEVLETAVNLQDLVLDKEFVRVRQLGAIRPLPTQPLAPWTYNFLEYIEGLKENRTGVTRYNQGLDARSLNKTATGIQLIMSASQQRLELIARIFAETGIKDFFRFLIELNQRFITQDVVIRLTNQTLQISPEDIRGDFDLEINAGMGVGVKEQQLQNLQMIMQVYPQLVQAGIVTPKNIYNLAKKFIEALGFKNVDEFLTDPEKLQGGINAIAGNNKAAGANIEEILPLLESQRLAGSVSGIPAGGEKANISGMATEGS
ncbi:MAG: poly(3-hydroxybutyrate) depolymerase [Thermodesulfobacteriota bacterium]|nr:MAG: poly(3-hydroxybutyrate) depolymerase [Thermodesulfobacteriota bacterium]